MPLPGAEISFDHASAHPCKVDATAERAAVRAGKRSVWAGVDTPPKTYHWSTYALDDVQPTSTATDIFNLIFDTSQWLYEDPRCAIPAK